MKRFIIIILLYLTTLPAVSFGEDLHETRLNSGLRSTEAYSYLLIEKAHENRAESAQLLKEAAKNSPDLPAVYFELAKTSFSPSSSGIFESINYIIEGIAAYSRNFWSAFTLAGSLLFSVMISFVISAAIIVVNKIPRRYPAVCPRHRRGKISSFVPCSAHSHINHKPAFISCRNAGIVRYVYEKARPRSRLYFFGIPCFFSSPVQGSIPVCACVVFLSAQGHRRGQ